MRRQPRDPTRVYDLLRRLGHDGTEDDIAERVVEAADAAGVRADAIAAGMPSSAPIGSEAWRQNRAMIVSIIVACIARTGRLGCLITDAGAVSWEPDGDRVEPGTAEGEADGRPLRYDLINARPVPLRWGGTPCVARFPPFDGRVRVERTGERPAVVALDDLDDDAGRRALASAPIRRRVEMHVRCSVRACGRAFRGWLDAERMTVEDTRGETICGLADLFSAKCEEHKSKG